MLVWVSSWQCFLVSLCFPDRKFSFHSSSSMFPIAPVAMPDAYKSGMHQRVHVDVPLGKDRPCGKWGGQTGCWGLPLQWLGSRSPDTPWKKKRSSKGMDGTSIFGTPTKSGCSQLWHQCRSCHSISVEVFLVSPWLISVGAFHFGDTLSAFHPQVSQSLNEPRVSCLPGRSCHSWRSLGKWKWQPLRRWIGCIIQSQTALGSLSPSPFLSSSSK